uniref:SBP-type domain-containing protein n=1 Tax=Hyaloperonospora arabidopsidis (strain Emoy2) TaxID=559515 RepID=M4BIP8_HYAAE
MSSTNTAATAASTSDNKQTVTLLPTEVRCSYPSKLCNNHRAVKDNGDLHKLCDFHRKKANVNQQRMQQKRRLIRQQMVERKKRFMDAAQVPMEYNAVTNMMEPKEPICDLSHEEVMMLESMLFDDEDSEGCAFTDEDLTYTASYPMSMAMGSYAASSLPSGNMSL